MALKSPRTQVGFPTPMWEGSKPSLNSVLRDLCTSSGLWDTYTHVHTHTDIHKTHVIKNRKSSEGKGLHPAFSLELATLASGTLVL